jgi:hypothetical protein
VDALLQRVQRDEPEPGLDSRLGRAGPLLIGEQVAEPPEGQLVQTLALGGEPLLEPPLVQGQPGQQITPVQVGDLLERGRAAIGDQSLESGRVHIDNGWIQSHRRAVENHGGPGAPGQGGPDPRERLAQVASSLGVRHVAPQQSRNLLARMRPAERKRQVGQEGLRLLRGQSERSAGFISSLESSQKGKFYARPGRQCSPVSWQEASLSMR